jgi:hypothetical protein
MMQTVHNNLSERRLMWRCQQLSWSNSNIRILFRQKDLRMLEL